MVENVSSSSSSFSVIITLFCYFHLFFNEIFFFASLRLVSFSPFRSSGQKNQKKQEEKKAEPSPISDPNSSSPKNKGNCLMRAKLHHHTERRRLFTNLDSFSSSPSWFLMLACLCVFHTPICLRFLFFFFFFCVPLFISHHCLQMNQWPVPPLTAPQWLKSVSLCRASAISRAPKVTRAEEVQSASVWSELLWGDEDHNIWRWWWYLVRIWPPSGQNYLQTPLTN